MKHDNHTLFVPFNTLMLMSIEFRWLNVLSDVVKRNRR